MAERASACQGSCRAAVAAAGPCRICRNSRQRSAPEIPASSARPRAPASQRGSPFHGCGLQNLQDCSATLGPGISADSAGSRQGSPLPDFCKTLPESMETGQGRWQTLLAFFWRRNSGHRWTQMQRGPYVFKSAKSLPPPDPQKSNYPSFWAVL